MTGLSRCVWRGAQAAECGGGKGRARDGSRQLVAVVKAIAKSGKAAADDEEGAGSGDEEDELQHELEL